MCHHQNGGIARGSITIVMNPGGSPISLCYYVTTHFKNKKMHPSIGIRRIFCTFAKDDKKDSDNSRIRCRGFVGCIVDDKA